VRFCLQEAQGRVQASRLNQVGSRVQPQRIETEFAGSAFQVLHEPAGNALAARSRLHEDPGDLADPDGAHPHAGAAENSVPLPCQQKEARGCDEVFARVSRLGVHNLLVSRGAPVVPTHNVLVVLS